MSVKNPVFVVLCIVLICGTVSQVYTDQYVIPHWIKNNANWWYQNQIDDSAFIRGIQYLVENKIMIVPASVENTSKENKIPLWVKNNAGWWANGTISDNEFVSGIQYLISSGIIVVKSDSNVTSSNSQCDHYTTDAEKETCLEKLDYDAKIQNYLKATTPSVVGPVTFYYINSESESVSDGKTILTVHFVVQNTADHQVIMTCQGPNSCNYSLSDGQNEISYSTNTLVYGSLTLIPNTPTLLDWTFYASIDSSKNYTFLVKESWGSGSIPIKIACLF
jgi:hypothetical protein